MRGKRKEVRKGISQSHTLATPGRGGGRGERDSQGEEDVDPPPCQSFLHRKCVL